MSSSPPTPNPIPPRVPLTALLGGFVVGLEEALAGVAEDAVPGHLLEEAELGVVVDEHHPAADLLQGAEPQRPHRQVPQRQRVGAAAETPPGERRRTTTTPHTHPTPPPPRVPMSHTHTHTPPATLSPCPRSLVQHAAPDDPQVLEDAQVLQAGWPGGDVEEACGDLSVTTPCVSPPHPGVRSPPGSPHSHPSAPPDSQRSAAVWGPGAACWCWGPCRGREGGWRDWGSRWPPVGSVRGGGGGGEGTVLTR